MEKKVNIDDGNQKFSMSDSSAILGRKQTSTYNLHRRAIKSKVFSKKEFVVIKVIVVNTFSFQGFLLI